MASTTTTTKLQQQQPTGKKISIPPKAPADVLEFLQATLFLEHPDLGKGRVGSVQLVGIVGTALALAAYIAGISLLILLACLVTPMLPALQSGFATALQLLTPSETWCNSAYHFHHDGPVLRLSRFLSTRVVSAIGRGTSTVGMAADTPALQRLATQSSYVATM